jgi:hypothetical protein
MSRGKFKERDRWLEIGSQAENVPLSLQPTPSRIAGEPSAKIEAVLADPEDGAENATAMHVLELYNRLGEFMRPPKSS